MIEKMTNQQKKQDFYSKLESSDFLLSKVPKEQWANLSYIDKIISRNEIKLEDFDEEKNATPFFLDFGDSLLQQMKDELEGKFVQDQNKSSKIIKKRADNEFLDESVDQMGKLLSQISTNGLEEIGTKETTSKIYKDLFELLKGQSSFEIDHFIKRETMMNPENAIRLLRMFAYLFENNRKDFDFKCVLLKSFLESSADPLLQIIKESPLEKMQLQKLFEKIKVTIKTCSSQNESSFTQVVVVLERIINASPLPQ